MDRKLDFKNSPFEKSPEKTHRSLLICFILLIIFTGTALNLLFDLWHSSLKTKRNPFFRRAWVEHVYDVKPKQPGEKLIIIISNSQGYGKEIKDEHTYASLLEKYLRLKLKSPVRVLNWSVPGGSGAEYTLLAAASHRLNPDILLLMAPPASFQHKFMVLNKASKPQIPWASDCHFLLGFSDVLRYVPKPFIDHFYKGIDPSDLYLGRIFPLWRYRTLPMAWLMQFKIFRPFEKYGAVDRWGLFKEVRQNRNKASSIAPVGKIDFQLLNVYLQATRSLKAKKIFASMPLKSLARNRYTRFTEQYRDDFKASGFEAWDLSDQISDDSFVTFSHMNERGHKEIAKLLAERLTS